MWTATKFASSERWAQVAKISAQEVERACKPSSNSLPSPVFSPLTKTCCMWTETKFVSSEHWAKEPKFRPKKLKGNANRPLFPSFHWPPHHWRWSAVRGMRQNSRLERWAQVAKISAQKVERECKPSSISSPSQAFSPLMTTFSTCHVLEFASSERWAQVAEISAQEAERECKPSSISSPSLACSRASCTWTATKFVSSERWAQVAKISAQEADRECKPSSNSSPLLASSRLMTTFSTCHVLVFASSECCARWPNIRPLK